MKIPPPFGVVAGAAGTAPRASGGAKAVAPAHGSRCGRVDRHRGLWQLHALESSLAASSEFDPARVEAIRRAIRDGKLTIDPHAVADRMLAANLSLLCEP